MCPIQLNLMVKVGELGLSRGLLRPTPLIFIRLAPTMGYGRDFWDANRYILIRAYQNETKTNSSNGRTATTSNDETDHNRMTGNFAAINYLRHKYHTR